MGRAAHAVGPGILTARRADAPGVDATAEADPGAGDAAAGDDPAQDAVGADFVGGATAVWWPEGAATPRAIQRPRALVMDATIPTPDQDSGSLCSVSYARTLVSLGYRVTFVPMDLQYDARYTRDLESWGGRGGRRAVDRHVGARTLGGAVLGGAHDPPGSLRAGDRSTPT